MQCLWTTNLIQIFHSTLIPFWGLPHFGAWGYPCWCQKLLFFSNLKTLWLMHVSIFTDDHSHHCRHMTNTKTSCNQYSSSWLPPQSPIYTDTGSHRQDMHDQRTTYIRTTRQRDTDPQEHIEEAAVGMAMAISTPTMDHDNSPECDHPTHSGPNRRPAQQDTSFLIELYCGI